MKHTIILLLSCIVFACQTKKESIKDFIPGMYESKGETALSKAAVHLTIVPVERNSEDYIAKYERSFQQKIDGEWLPAKVEKTTIPMTFNPSTNQLEDAIKNKVITFFPDKNTLMLNQAIYTKIK